MLALRHFEFRSRLIDMGKRRGTRVIVTNEAYTSKTCTACGHIHDGLGGAKVFRCPKCEMEIGRDANGARGINLRHLDATGRSEQALDLFTAGPTNGSGAVSHPGGKSLPENVAVAPASRRHATARQASGHASRQASGHASVH